MHCHQWWADLYIVAPWICLLDEILLSLVLWWQLSWIAGDVKLSALRKALGESGISADFHSGMLVCQERVLVKPSGTTGQLVLEGPVCEIYYKIREILYAQYHMCWENLYPVCTLVKLRDNKSNALDLPAIWLLSRRRIVFCKLIHRQFLSWLFSSLLQTSLIYPLFLPGVGFTQDGVQAYMSRMNRQLHRMLNGVYEFYLPTCGHIKSVIRSYQEHSHYRLVDQCMHSNIDLLSLTLSPNYHSTSQCVFSCWQSTLPCKTAININLSSAIVHSDWVCRQSDDTACYLVEFSNLYKLQ